MASQPFATRIKRNALAVALGLCFASGVQAQTNTAGAVNGRAVAGDTITLTNPGSGYSRTVTVGADGTYRFAQVPTGQYQVSRNGESPRPVPVNVGTTSNVDFVLADATTLGRVSRWCEEHAVLPQTLTLGQRTLEDVFLDLTGRELAS